MTDSRKDTRRRARGDLLQLLALSAFGLATLGFCIAVDRLDWFRIRPAGSAAAPIRNAAVPAQASHNGAAGMKAASGVGANAAGQVSP